MAVVPKGSSYSDSRYGLVQRYICPTKDDLGTAGTLADIVVAFPKKSLIRKFGVIANATDITCSTTTEVELRTINGTKLATFVPGSCVIATGMATGCAPETATTVAANAGMIFCVGTDTADAGTVFYFIDYTQDFEPTV